ncbi:MAG: septal ring lytic transglycosylase RlpA family protein, partial [bacterium]|nr:septal ring lytic transglycosylase RlpA family protein [bacterium]
IKDLRKQYRNLTEDLRGELRIYSQELAAVRDHIRQLDERRDEEEEVLLLLRNLIEQRQIIKSDIFYVRKKMSNLRQALRENQPIAKLNLRPAFLGASILDGAQTKAESTSEPEEGVELHNASQTDTSVVTPPQPEDKKEDSPEEQAPSVLETGLEQGIASFYSVIFNGRKTANGEIFSNSKYTAAHKTLPLGTWVKLTNMGNGKTTIVRINDRGPYAKGRIIDLSKKAFQLLEENLYAGLIWDVKLEVLKDYQPTACQARSEC